MDRTPENKRGDSRTGIWRPAKGAGCRDWSNRSTIHGNTFLEIIIENMLAAGVGN